MLNEGFDIFNRQIKFTDEHEDILNTSLSGNITHTTPYIYDLKDNIDVYSLFKRIEISNDYYHPYDKNVSDGNPVLYALKQENGWRFCNLKNYNNFWYRFEQILNKFLIDHKNNYDTVLCIPSSNFLNTNIINSIKKIANKVGIKHIITDGLKTLRADEVYNAIIQPNSYFRSKFKNDVKAVREVNKFIKIMNDKNNGIFKYHMISDEKYRAAIINTLYVDETFDYEYKIHINDKNILIIDDSITLGQSIKNTIYAITNTYNPKTISVLTMFSELYDINGNQKRKWEDEIYRRK